MFIIEWWRELENSEKMFVFVGCVFFVCICLAAIAYGGVGIVASFFVGLVLVFLLTMFKLVLMMFEPAEF